MSRRRIRWFLAAGTAAVLVTPAPLAAQNPEESSRPTEPFLIVGNVYWVGTYDLSSFLITSPDGHIVIHTGLADWHPKESRSRAEGRTVELPSHFCLLNSAF